MELDQRLNFIREFFQSARVAEHGYLPVTDRDVNEAKKSLGTTIEEMEKQMPISAELQAIYS